MMDNPQNTEWHAVYFKPGQLVFHVSGEATEASNDELLKWANQLANQFAGSNNIKISITNPRMQRFSSGPSRFPDRQPGAPLTERTSQLKAHSLVYTDITRENDAGIPIEEEITSEEAGLQLLDLIFLLDEQRQEAPGDPVQVVSPNWLTSGTSKPGTTGGPGGRPTPYAGTPDNTEYQFYFDETKLTSEFLTHIKDGTGEGVVVAILDTAPASEELDDFYNAHKNHSLILTLIDPMNRRLHVHADPRVQIPPLSNLQCIGYDYDMNDHGIFVAGIIHSLALRAELHLFQVLNRYGVGDLEIIGDALERVFQEFGDGKGVPLVVNLSLNFNIPLERAHTRSGRKNVVDAIGQKIFEYKPRRSGGMPWLERVAGLLEPISDILEALGGAVIAAAGNDYDQTHHGPQRPKARYPAAFNGVVGVGALPRMAARPPAGTSLVTASYSNLSDRPPKSGITTLGGEEGAGKGVLGIYMGNFPPADGSANPTKSSNGWGWWAGTSFAAPIITGITAAVLSSKLSEDPQATTQAAIQELYGAQQHVTSGATEDVLFVTQGLPPTP